MSGQTSAINPTHTQTSVVQPTNTSDTQGSTAQSTNPSSGRHYISTPSFRHVSTSVSQAARKITRVAVPIAALVAVASLPSASAGPLAYWTCCEITCGGGAAVSFPPWLLACLTGCIPLLAAPTP